MEPNKEMMEDKEKIHEAQNTRTITCEGIMYSQGRSNEASIEFIKLQVQLATLLLGLTGIFWNVYTNSLEDISPTNLLKIAFIIVLFLLIGSITMGLLYLKIVERHWDELTSNKALRFSKWEQVIRKRITFEEAVSFHEGTNLGSGHMIYTPNWPWIIQSILLGLS